MLHTLGNPVLPLVYIMTATSAGRGKSTSTGFSRPSLSTSVNKVMLQVLLCSTDEAIGGISSSIQIMRFTVSSCPLISASFFSSFCPQITVVTSVWREPKKQKTKNENCDDRIKVKTGFSEV